MICSRCGAQNMDGVTFCGSCGAQMETPSQTQTFIQQQPMNEQPDVNQPDATGTSPTTSEPYGSGQPGNQPYAGGQPAADQPMHNSSTATTYATPGGGPSNGGLVMPKNYMVEAIIVTVVSMLCCCSPISVILGIIAIIKANNVNPEFERGNLTEAISNSESAKKLTIWAAGIAVAFCIILFVLYFAFLGALINEAGGFDSLLNNM